MSKAKRSQEAAMSEALVESGLIPRLREYAAHVPTMIQDNMPIEELAASWSAAVLAALRGWHLERGRAGGATSLEKRLDAIFALPAERQSCEKCRSANVGVRWDASYFECLKREQDRHDWPNDNGEHMHYVCRTCGWSWAVTVEAKA
jgi:hypothetical protein